LKGEDRLGGGPQPVEIEQSPLFWGENVHHHRAVVDNEPILVRADALGMKRPLAFLLQFLGDFVEDSASQAGVIRRQYYLVICNA